jgi:N-acetylglucosaminyl-diphospho-decaprenol L-rhamnosyltransferase
VTIDVVVPTFNRADLLRGCLEHLARQDVPHTAIVVDNGSSDGTAEMVRTEFPDVRLVALVENLGFGRAVQLGVEAGDGEAIVLINNDVDVLPGFLRALVAPLERDPGAGMVAGVLLRPGEQVIDAAGVVIDRGLGGYGYLVGAPVAAIDAPPPGLMGPCGGAAAYRRSAYEQIGGFDPEIFAYSEDLDIALRMLAAGWTCTLAPDARAIHLGSATLGLRSLQQVRIGAASRGYVLGRYRVGVGWLATEVAVALADAAVNRSPAPLVERARGFARGRRLPRRAVPQVEAMGWRTAMRRRLRAARQA